LLKDIQQALAADAGKTVTTRARRLAAIVNSDVVPVDERFADECGAFRVVGFEIGQRLIGQHNAPTERVVRPVALDDDNLVRGIAPLERDREIEATRAAAETNRAHCPIRSLR